MSVRVVRVFAMSAVFVCVVATQSIAQGGPQPQYETTPTHKHNPQSLLWKQYYQAGVKYEQAGNTEMAKRYYLSALQVLEQASKSRRDYYRSKLDGKTYKVPFLTVSVQQFEGKLAGLYPNDWSKAQGTTAQQLALREEQAGVLYRLAQLNKADARMQKGEPEKYQKQYDAAAEELKKAKEAASPAPSK